VLAVVAACPAQGPPAESWPVLDTTFIASAAATYNFQLGRPTVLAITRDGAVLFRRTAPREFTSDLYELTPAGQTRVLVTAAELIGDAEEQLSDAEQARRERSRTATRGVVDIGVSEDGRFVMIPLAGVFHFVDRTSGMRTVVDPRGEAYDPQLAPDGSAIAFVRGGNIWLVTPRGELRQLTEHPPDIEYGVAEFVAQEEFARRRGFW
jgi:dipeptidyl-peptidase-4